MIEYVQDFIDRINEREHILLLIEDVELKISFIIEEKQQMLSIFFCHGEVILLNDMNTVYDSVEIYGEQCSFKVLMEGRETLRTLMKTGDLRVSAPFRTLLLLESLFYLGKITSVASS